MTVKKTREVMRTQDPAESIKNFNEVALGYTEEQALSEAGRCLRCKNKPCTEGCPVEIDIPGFIELIRNRDFMGAARKIKETNNLPAITGRVCPQEDQCEICCVLGKKSEPLAIGRLERFVADYERNQSVFIPALSASRHRKVAVIGSGPAGLTAAADLRKKGYAVTVFEALHDAGGVLIYGIPEFRLPKDIVRQEISYIEKLGVAIKVDSVIGKITSVDELMAAGYDAVFVGTGAGLPSFMNIPGENLNSVYSANEFLTRTNLMKAYQFPGYDTPVQVGKRVAVVGGGNVAMDAARCSLRLGAEEVYIVYRRSEAEMPARKEEVEHAKEEGVRFKMLCTPSAIIDNGEGWVQAIECYSSRLGEPDDSGRRRPVRIEGSEHVLEVETVIMAIGNKPNPLISRTTPELQTGKNGILIADPATGATTKKGVYAGGDIVTGAATVISAMGAGKQAAAAIDAYLSNS